MTPVPVTSADNALTSFASHAGSDGSAQSGISVVLVDAASVKFLVVNPHGSENTSGEPPGTIAAGTDEDQEFSAGYNGWCCHFSSPRLGTAYRCQLNTLDQRTKTQRYMTRDPVRITQIRDTIQLKHYCIVTCHRQRLVIECGDDGLADCLALGKSHIARPAIEAEKYFGAIDAIGLVGQDLTIAQRDIRKRCRRRHVVIDAIADDRDNSSIGFQLSDDCSLQFQVTDRSFG